MNPLDDAKRRKAKSPTPQLTTNTKPTYTPDVVCLADVTPVSVPWLWPQRVPLGRITLVSGRPGGGKTFFTIDLTARVSTGASWPDGAGHAPLGSVVIMNAEDDPADTLAPRTIAAGADRSRIHCLRGERKIDPDGTTTTLALTLANLDTIRAALDTLPDCKLLIIDPIGSYLGAGTDAHRDNEVRTVLAPLAALASERGIAVVLVCHTRKSSADFADDTVLGSRAFTGLARSVWHLSDDAEDRTRKLLLPGKSNLAVTSSGLAFRIVTHANGTGTCAWEDDPVDTHADDVMHRVSAEVPHRGPAPVKRSAAADWLATLLADGPMITEDVKRNASDAGHSWATIRRASEALKVVSEKQSFSGKWAWRLPEDQPEQLADEPPTCPRDIEPEHLGESPCENIAFPVATAEDAQVVPLLGILGTIAQDARAVEPSPTRTGQVDATLMNKLSRTGTTGPQLLAHLKATAGTTLANLTPVQLAKAIEHLATMPDAHHHR